MKDDKNLQSSFGSAKEIDTIKLIPKAVSVDKKNNTLMIRGKVYPFAKGMMAEHIVMKNKDVFIDGYQLVDGKWKKTLKAIGYNWLQLYYQRFERKF